MSQPESVRQWISRLQTGDPAAAQRLWELYFARLVGLVRAKLQGLARRAADEEDVALSAFDSFCQGAAAGRYPQLSDADNLWPLLVLIATRKACDLAQHQRRQKRGGGKVQGESGVTGPGPDGRAKGGFDQFPGEEPAPEMVAQVAEEYRRLLDLLGDEQLRAVAQWKMEGYTNEEIAAKLGCVLRTVERKLRAIRSIWEGQEAEVRG
jgi:DNA-directed RNA polymerase specialized sigma24 family protein